MQPFAPVDFHFSVNFHSMWMEQLGFSKSYRVGTLGTKCRALYYRIAYSTIFLLRKTNNSIYRKKKPKNKARRLIAPKRKMLLQFPFLTKLNPNSVHKNSPLFARTVQICIRFILFVAFIQLHCPLRFRLINLIIYYGENIWRFDLRFPELIANYFCTSHLLTAFMLKYTW